MQMRCIVYCYFLNDGYAAARQINIVLMQQFYFLFLVILVYLSIVNEIQFTTCEEVTWKQVLAKLKHQSEVYNQ